MSQRAAGLAGQHHLVRYSLCVILVYLVMLSGELIVNKYVAESITMIAERFGHEGLCQLHTELKKLQCETCYIANMVSSNHCY